MLLSSLLTLAVVVVPHVSSPPPAPTPPSTGQNECKYSAMINTDRYQPIYQCYSQEEWDQRNADIAAQRAESDKQNAEDAEAFGKWWSSHWVIVPSIIIGMVVSSILFKKLEKHRKMKEYPYMYDDNGNLKYPWN